MWSEVDDNARVGNGSVLWYLLDFVMCEDEDGVSPWSVHFLVALRLVAKFLVEGVHPDLFRDGVPCQLFVADDEFARGRMCHRGA